MATASLPILNALANDPWETILNGENLLILAVRPGDESLTCGGLVAHCCGCGRAPFVVILTDGSTTSALPDPHAPDDLALLHERETRLAVQCLGLPPQRLLMAGLFDNTVPADGPDFEAMIRGITQVMWARDCNVICAPPVNDPVPDRTVASRVAVEVARRSGVGLLFYDPSAQSPAAEPRDDSDGGWRMDITPYLAAKRAAITTHVSRFGETIRDQTDLRPYEVLCLGGLPRIL